MNVSITVSLLNQDNDPVNGQVILIDGSNVRVEANTVNGIATFVVDSAETYFAYVLSTEATFQRYSVALPADGANYDMFGASVLKESSAAFNACRVYGYAVSLAGVPDESFVFRAQAVSGALSSGEQLFTRNTATALVSGEDGFFYLDLPYGRDYLVTTSLGCPEGFTRSRQVVVPAVASRKLQDLVFPHATSVNIPAQFNASEDEQTISVSATLTDGRVLTDQLGTYLTLELFGDIDAALEASQIIVKRASVQSGFRLSARLSGYSTGGSYDWDTDYNRNGGTLGESTAQ